MTRFGRIAPLRRRVIRGFALPALLAVLAVAGTVLPLSASAQHEGGAGSAPPPPPGPGNLTVQVLSPESPDSVGGVPIALYALGPDGTPGLAESETDAEGRTEFTGISNDPQIIYLVGARYADIPFGERVTFAEGTTSARVVISVSTPTSVVSGVTVEELRTRIDWMGDRLLLTEIIRLSNSSSRVIQLSPDQPNESILERPLSPAATDFNAGPNSMGEGLDLVNGSVRFRGPLYPGEQRVEYRYSLPIDDRDHIQIPIEMREAVARVVVVAGTSGVDVKSPGLVASRDVSSENGQRLSSWSRAGLRAGQSIDVALTLPESRRDPSLVSIPRGDVWLDLDDTRVNANVDLQLKVEPGPPVSGTAEAPLFKVTLPLGANLQGVSPETEAMGVVPRADGGFDVIGPIAPGDHNLGFNYRVASQPDGVSLGMQFPREVETLNVLIADTGLALDSSRLHRRRPFRSGTRNFLHREAFNVSPTETVDLSLEPLRATGIPQQASIGIAIAAVALAAFFAFAPLRKIAEREVLKNPALVSIRDAREAVYVAISDLDHDFETGKLNATDHEQMRSDLLGQAIELLRQERAAEDGVAAQATPGVADEGAQPAEAGQDPARQATPSTPANPPIAPIATARFCPSCGGETHPDWKFCTHCGGGLNPAGAGSLAPGDAPA